MTYRSRARDKKQRIAEARLAASQLKIREHRKEKKRKADLIRYYESKRKEWREQAKASSTASSRVQELEAKNASLRQQVDILSQRAQDLHHDFLQKETEVERLTEELEPEIVTVENGSYTPKFRALVYRLLSRNIAQEQVSPVIEDVFKFAGKKASQLPTPKTIAGMNMEKLALSQTQIGVNDTLRSKMGKNTDKKVIQSFTVPRARE